VKVVETLLDHGADLHARTAGQGGTPLWWAYKYHDEGSEMIEFLKNLGAKNIGPDDKDEL
jgi:hypothetical protein